VEELAAGFEFEPELFTTTGEVGPELPPKTGTLFSSFCPAPRCKPARPRSPL
jgi:hypothetical protein